MPMYDRTCETCDHVVLDSLESMKDTTPRVCPLCERKTLVRAVSQGHANGVTDDSIPGGLVIKHGLCWPDGSPRKFYSHSEIRKAEKELGWTNVVEHVPTRGSDKSPHTINWASAPPAYMTPEGEAARLAAWHAFDEQDT